MLPAPSGAVSILARGDLVGDWEITGRIGRGGMSIVYGAVHTVIGKRAALKMIRSELSDQPGLVDRFVNEARIVNRIAHPGLVDIFQIGWHGGRVYLVMELLGGRGLAARMKESALSTSEAVALIGAICRPLGWAHAHGVVHRDLKPDNVFVVEETGDTRVKLLDWGLAAAMCEGRFVAPEPNLVGTPRYIAPEQACGERVDERADLYALGAIAYELLLGRAPFESDDVEALVRMHLEQAPAPPHTLWPAIPTELDALLTALLAKDPGERPSLATVHATLVTLGGRLPERAGALAPVASAPCDTARTWDMPGVKAAG
jgi:eukaryotic-like serine/threonine-protein kinase